MKYRVPEEPNTDKYPAKKGISLPDQLDFTKLSTSENSHLAIQNHMKECIRVGLELTDLKNEQFDFVTTKNIGKGNSSKIRVESTSIAGTSDPKLMGIRHIARLDGLHPDYLFDAYNRLNYTDIIDKYTYLVEMIEEIDVPRPEVENDNDDDDDISWCHVVLTADRLIPIFFSVRDFVTFDFVSRRHRMLVSRSCIHPNKPQTSPPSTFDLTKTKTYRVPLQYVLRILPCPEDENSCIVVQFQYSDMGGIIPPPSQTKAVIDFGIDNIPKFFNTVLEAKHKGLALGPGTEGYLKNPLKPKWRQRPKDMLPGM